MMTNPAPYDLFDITDRCLFVSGGAGAIGSGLVASLLALGAKVVSFDRAEHKPAPDNPRLLRLVGDATVDADVAHAMASAAARFGMVHTLVNAAGINIRASVADMRMEDLQDVMNVNLYTAVLLSKAFAAIEGGEGRSIVNIASLAGSYGIAGAAAYSASKAAMISFTQVCAIEWAARGIRVNALAPSAIRTPMMEPRLSDPTQAAALLSRIPLGRIGEPADLVGPIVFLASKSSSWITGHILAVDGGRTATS